MKTHCKSHLMAALLSVVLTTEVVAVADVAPLTEPGRSEKLVPWSELGANAKAQYSGDGLAVSPTVTGVRLRSVFQKLEGEATREGLWLTSAAGESRGERFRVVASALGRQPSSLGVAADVSPFQLNDPWFGVGDFSFTILPAA